jgi:hypothetical protein
MSILKFPKNTIDAHDVLEEVKNLVPPSGKVLCLYYTEEGHPGWYGQNCTMAEMLWVVELFKQDLITGNLT